MYIWICLVLTWETCKRAFTVATAEAGRDDEVNGREFCYWTAKKKAAFQQNERKYDRFHRQCAFPEYVKEREKHSDCPGRP
jgi:hypothetical protein